MTQLLSFSVFVAVFAASPFFLVAQEEEAVAASEELLGVMNMEELLEQNIEASLDSQMAQFEQMGLGAEGIQALKEEMLSFMNDVMAYEELEPELVAIYAEAFSTEELQELTAFYQSPIGKKTIALMPTLMAQGMELGQEKVQARMGELQARLVPIFEKYPPTQLGQ